MGCPSEPPEETNLANTLILDFRPPEILELKTVVLSHTVCRTLL